MPRVRLIYHGLYMTPQGHGPCWAPPTMPFGECDHPRSALRFDPRFGVPTSCYCRACGEAYIHPHHGLTEDEIAEIKRKGRELWLAIGGDDDTDLDGRR